MCERNENIPKIGMMFANESEAHNYYNTYAGMTCFSIRKDQYRRLTNGSLRLRTFVCSKEGQRKAKDPTHVTKRQRRETRTGCQARISFLIEDDLWIVSQFISEHNHDLVKPSIQSELRSQRHIDEAKAAVIEVMDDFGAKPHVIYSYLVELAGGAENVGFSKGDLDNFLRNRRKNMLAAGDAQGVLNHFNFMQAIDPSFFYTPQVNSENRMTNFFWTDGISKADYAHFGDVVIFDTTY
ncbi:protein FAR1-RELATED SEQUENCE 5-like [Quillaja saponaria]|uniref:Protein FAR1-RELATED SEQUENCE 5-like n=1 Tax=Quillaja saponaria TaxID=32244 RepID=A0AAD7PQA8_QUISA|nr:protein FAR1-RELATED SEQUENCE 5-like [Quillaja saponaria]KAJ7963928.1 protein FAR1-RELATED SEQUENCE 5-like [Quillaja saponaria]